MREDAELVELAVGGDSAAFSELYERYFDSVYDFLGRMVRDREEAADLAQDTFLRAMNSLPSLSQGGSFRSWVFTIARNTALNRLERSSRLQPLEQQSDEGEDLEMQVVDPDRFGNPEEAAEAKDYAALVWEAASSLDQRQYAALHYSVRLGFDNEELAEVLGVTRNNAYQIINRTKQAMESAIGALVLLRQGRRFCKELDATLAKLQVAELTPDLKHAIDRHAARCENCKERRRKLASPFAAFAGLAFIQPASGVKAAILENVQAGFAQTYGAGASQSSAGMPPGESMSPLGGAAGGAIGGSGGGPSGVAGLDAGDGDGEAGGGKWKIAVLGGVGGAVTALLLLVAGFGLPSGDEKAKGAAAETPTAAPTLGIVVPSATATPPPAPTATAVLPTATPEPQNAPPAATEPPLQTPPTATATTPPPPPTNTPPATSTPTNCTLSMTVSPSHLDFGADQSSLPLFISVEGCDLDVDFELLPSEGWIAPVPSQGTIPADSQIEVTVEIRRSQLSTGANSGQIVVQSIVGQLTVQVSAEGARGQSPGGLRTP